MSFKYTSRHQWWYATQESHRTTYVVLTLSLLIRPVWPSTYDELVSLSQKKMSGWCDVSCADECTSGHTPPPPPSAHARPCLSTEWALTRRFEEILGPLSLWSRKEGLGVCRALVQGKRGPVMFVIVHSLHNNFVPHIATPCCCSDVIFSHGQQCYAWHGCHVRLEHWGTNMRLPLLLVPLVTGTIKSL